MAIITMMTMIMTTMKTMTTTMEPVFPIVNIHREKDNSHHNANARETAHDGKHRSRYPDQSLLRETTIFRHFISCHVVVEGGVRWRERE